MSCMEVPLLRRRGCVTMLKLAYIMCAATLTTSFIVGGILIHLLVLPYLHESGFEPTSCIVVHTEPHMPVLKCENKCSKERSVFPCLRVTVHYQKNGFNHSGILFDTIATHQNYKRFGCVTSSCYQRKEENNFVVNLFRADLQKRGKFDCFVSADHADEALLYKFYRPLTIFNALFWPVALCVVSLFAILIMFAKERCKVWKTDSILIA